MVGQVYGHLEGTGADPGADPGADQRNVGQSGCHHMTTGQRWTQLEESGADIRAGKPTQGRC